MTYLIIFVTAAFASFVGSLQLGPVNLGVIHTAISKDMRSALRVSFGGALPEVLYAFLAVQGIEFLGNDSFIVRYATYFFAPVLIIIGLYTLFIKKKPKEVISETKGSKAGDFGKGLVLALLNPQIFTYWIAVMIYIGSTGIYEVNSWTEKLSFTFGAAVGALGLFITFAAISIRNKEKINSLVAGNINKVMGWIFIVLGIVQLVNIYLKNS